MGVLSKDAALVQVATRLFGQVPSETLTSLMRNQYEAMVTKDLSGLERCDPDKIPAPASLFRSFLTMPRDLLSDDGLVASHVAQVAAMSAQTIWVGRLDPAQWIMDLESLEPVAEKPGAVDLAFVLKHAEKARL